MTIEEQVQAQLDERATMVSRQLQAAVVQLLKAVEATVPNVEPEGDDPMGAALQALGDAVAYVPALEHAMIQAQKTLIGLQTIRELDGKYQMSFTGEGMRDFARAVVEMYRETDPPNYFGIVVGDPGTGEEFEITIQKRTGKTPSMIVEDLRAELARRQRWATTGRW